MEPLHRCSNSRVALRRSAEAREALLGEGAEAALRAVRDAPVSNALLKDAASAALRDLGIDDYHVPAQGA